MVAAKLSIPRYDLHNYFDIHVVHVHVNMNGLVVFLYFFDGFSFLEEC